MPPILPPGPVDVAQRVVLRRTSRLAPHFLSQVVRKRLVGHQLEAGERILFFQVAFTVPTGLVEVTDSTSIEFLD